MPTERWTTDESECGALHWKKVVQSGQGRMESTVEWEDVKLQQGSTVHCGALLQSLQCDYEPRHQRNDVLLFWSLALNCGQGALHWGEELPDRSLALWTVNCELWTVNCALWTVHCALWLAWLWNMKPGTPGRLAFHYGGSSCGGGVCVATNIVMGGGHLDGKVFCRTLICVATWAAGPGNFVLRTLQTLRSRDTWHCTIF